ncbi:DUF6215 domain-containing protein [Kitasatospora sp. NPDC051984]|uniref:DUF6215 domain-containing protein n=1 Tax=Kitasatospora sp. NPDC051984 TaxID=3364059 RepID=UPI0037CB30CB
MAEQPVQRITSQWVCGMSAVGALVLLGTVAWGSGLMPSAVGPGGAEPAACRPPTASDDPGYPATCAALNRPDLPQLLNLPGEHVSIAQPAGFLLTAPKSAAEVQIGSVKVALSVHPTRQYDADSALLDVVAGLDHVAGRPTMHYSDPTIAVRLGPGTAAPAERSSGRAEHLSVAQNADGSGGSLELVIWDVQGGEVNGLRLNTLAEKLIPTLDGWPSPPLAAEPGKSPRPSPSQTPVRPFGGR